MCSGGKVLILLRDVDHAARAENNLFNALHTGSFTDESDLQNFQWEWSQSAKQTPYLLLKSAGNYFAAIADFLLVKLGLAINSDFDQDLRPTTLQLMLPSSFDDSTVSALKSIYFKHGHSVKSFCSDKYSNDKSIFASEVFSWKDYFATLKTKKLGRSPGWAKLTTSSWTILSE
ncbi:hypothetical protein Ciccas_014156 [Cichlidogyrus casuarinus]|uniref:Uncharacterized protein n=1 Tax=Cichlidogyrus casuarinus TaxID=1844966 RepID=A0ABD2PIW3_9PLAT